eukprot:TRINITY_DN5678_c1_g2_i2.p1 TRINITY_DN5678_c1_g2~~TRINITY_DN5678_c1_g2_i2.p1  ORF type:complete len:208 (-),score=55.30 TRINITY_DN5678_c1_g2_i2:424-1047(-)
MISRARIVFFLFPFVIAAVPTMTSAAVVTSGTAQPVAPAKADGSDGLDASSLFSSVFSAPSFDELAAFADRTVKEPATIMHDGMKRFADFNSGVSSSSSAATVTDVASTPGRTWRTRPRSTPNSADGEKVGLGSAATVNDECHEQCKATVAEHVRVTQQLCPLMLDNLRSAATGAQEGGVMEALRLCEEDESSVVENCAMHCARQDL